MLRWWWSDMANVARLEAAFTRGVLAYSMLLAAFVLVLPGSAPLPWMAIGLLAAGLLMIGLSLRTDVLRSRYTRKPRFDDHPSMHLHDDAMYVTRDRRDQ